MIIFLTSLKYQKSLFVDIENITFKSKYFYPVSSFMNLSIYDTDFNKCNLEGSKFLNCDFKNVKFIAMDLHYSKFENCILDNVDFSESKRKFTISQIFNPFNLVAFLSVIPENMKEILNEESIKSIFLNHVFANSIKITFSNINPENIDEATIISLKKMIVKNNYIIGKHIVGDEWLMERLRNLEIE